MGEVLRAVLPFSPECVKCGLPALGGCLQKASDGIYDIDYYCDACVPLGGFSTLVRASHHWRILSKKAPGSYRLTRAAPTRVVLE